MIKVVGGGYMQVNCAQLFTFNFIGITDAEWSFPNRAIKDKNEESVLSMAVFLSFFWSLSALLLFSLFYIFV